jgi:hypothetical protein
MRKATLIAMVTATGFVVMAGCDNRTLDRPRTPPQTVQRSTTIWAPVDASPNPDVGPAEPAEPAKPEPAMSIPPAEDSTQGPAAAPAPQPRAPSRTPSNYRDRCGRPLIT